MNGETYIKEVLRTVSPHMNEPQIGTKQLFGLLSSVETNSILADIMKRGLFYKNPDPTPKSLRMTSEHDGLLDYFSTEKGKMFLHGWLGFISEIGEVADSAIELAITNTNKDFYADEPIYERDCEYALNNFKLEVGDVLWYMALMLHAAGLSFEEVMQANVEKLKSRYPESQNCFEGPK